MLESSSVVQAVQVGLERFAGQAQDEVGDRLQPAPAHVDLERLVGIELDGVALDLAQHVLVQRLHGLIQHERAGDLLDRLDDALGPVLAGGRVDEGGPAEFALHFADVARDLDVALEHAVVRIRDAQRAHLGRAVADHARDVVDLLLHALDVEVVDLGVPGRALGAEGAGEGAAPVGLDHRREAAVEELVLDAGEPGGGDLVRPRGGAVWSRCAPPGPRGCARWRCPYP